MTELETAHKKSIYHRKEIEQSTLCGCFYCLETYPPSSILTWVDTERTALCPKCGIDSVIGNASGFPNSSEFLHRMRDRWFSDS